ncbi:hypothetical protein RZS08_37040, partial [Arthrospira platensis SPKY1]|nr:hypothetical protein [Arthrospira platensis SPKY1]
MPLGHGNSLAKTQIFSAQNLRIVFFDQVSGVRFATVKIDSVQPARRRVGFVTIPAPGYAYEGVSVRLWQENTCPSFCGDLSRLLQNM